MKNQVSEERLSLLAGARTIHRCAQQKFSLKVANSLLPELLSKYEILLGKQLIFSDFEFSKLLRKGYGVPKLKSFFPFPLDSMLSLSNLWKVGRVFKKGQKNTDILAILYGSLDAICLYLNRHPKAFELFISERKCTLGVTVVDCEKKYLLSYESLHGWMVTDTPRKYDPSACLTFKNIEVVQLSNLGNLDPWLSLVNGDVQLTGRIPMLDKFGYVARIAQKEIPRPK